MRLLNSGSSLQFSNAAVQHCWLTRVRFVSPLSVVAPTYHYGGWYHSMPRSTG
jgi:hypothetical protein